MSIFPVCARGESGASSGLCMWDARRVMDRTLCFLRGGFGALFLARYGAILIVACVLGVRCRDTLEQIDVARLLIDKYHDVRPSFRPLPTPPIPTLHPV